MTQTVEERRAYVRRWKQNNPDHYKRWAEANSDKLAANSRRWYTTNWRVALIRAAQRRAKRKGLEFSLPETWKEGCEHCEWSGLPFRLRHPIYAASIDRIHNDLGYTVDNCRLILRVLNTFKGEHKQEDVDTVLRALCRKVE